MEEKENNSQFKFSLYQGNILLCERVFGVDNFNNYTRYSIDIRDILPRIINRLQKVLSRKDNEIRIITEAWEYSKDDGYNPTPVTQQFFDTVSKEERTIKGVECKLGFYVNDKPIVERVFYVDNFNPKVRWSYDLVDTITDVTNMIFNKIKDNDTKNMFDDYDLVNKKGLTPTQIQELTPQKREELLRKLGN